MPERERPFKGTTPTGLGHTALVDLGSGSVQVFATPHELVRRYLGGRGLNMFYLWGFLRHRPEPLSPENPLIIGTGLLTGTPSPSASRLNVSARSPETGILGDSNMGGFFGPRLRAAGFDRLIITGRAREPVLLHVSDGQVGILPASEFWGLNTLEVQDRLKERFGRDSDILCIGRAGEKMVKMACIRSGMKQAAGRGGMGAVMGSKNLKAVVASGKGNVPVPNRKKALSHLRQLNQYLKGSKIIQHLGRFGTALLYDNSNQLGTIRTRNSQENFFTDGLTAAEFEKYTEKMLSCWGCVVHCRHRNVFGGEGPDYSTIGLLGANCGIDDAAQVIKLSNLVNDLGLDASSCGSVIGWAIELHERGLIPPDLVDRPLRYGDYEMMCGLLEDIAERRGLGDILAESTGAVRHFGEKSRDYLIAVKNLPQSDPHDCRYIKSFALGIAVASRGADHLRNRPTLDIFSFPAELNRQIYGAEVNPDPTSYETKEHVVYFSENIFSVTDSLGLCKFVCHGFNSPHLLKYEHFAGLIKLMTGMEFTEEDLRQTGKRIVDLERLINLREGLGRGDDTLPRRYFEDPLPGRVAQGHYIDRDEFDRLLSRYYALRGWDEDGRPPRETVREVELLWEEFGPV